MAQDYKFEGWLGLDKEAVNGKMVWGEFEPKPWEETDVDIQVTHSGICGTDVHTLRSGWVGCAPDYLGRWLTDAGAHRLPYLRGPRDRRQGRPRRIPG
jgi:hypothetical protein